MQWHKLTYIGKETRAITKVFKNTKIRVTYSTNNTLRKLLTKKHHPNRNKYENSRIYQITRPTCNMKYTGQTGGRSAPVFKNTYVTSNTETANPHSPSPAPVKEWTRHQFHGRNHGHHSLHQQRKANEHTGKVLHIP
jgi:hypothetical protein